MLIGLWRKEEENTVPMIAWKYLGFKYHKCSNLINGTVYIDVAQWPLYTKHHGSDAAEGNGLKIGSKLREWWKMWCWTERALCEPGAPAEHSRVRPSAPRPVRSRSRLRERPAAWCCPPHEGSGRRARQGLPEQRLQEAKASSTTHTSWTLILAAPLSRK